ncbi:MAG: lamin tail domain-containing protein [Candidatus Nanopelagicaceae bacterium]
MYRPSRNYFRFAFAIAILSIFIQPSFAITSLSELKIPDEQLASVTNRHLTLTTSLIPLIQRTTFGQEEFLRLRAERKGSGPEFQAAQNYLRSQIKSLYQAFSGQTQIKKASAQIYRKILNSPQMVTQFIATRPTVYLPRECPPAVALDGESIWETGTVVKVEDGDTVFVQTCRGNLDVRLIGVQAPETAKSTHFAQCGGLEASKLMKALLPVGTEVQLRSNNFASANNYQALARPYRYIFAKDAQGNFTIDVQAKLLEAGLAMWFPNENEFVRNLQYLELLNSAASNSVGLWSGSLCGNEMDKTAMNAIEIWVELDSPLPNENPFGEFVLLRNKTEQEINLSGWTLRDTSLELNDSKYAFPSGTILKGNSILTVYLGAPLQNFPLAPDEIALGLSKAILQNPSASKEKFTGDGIYLQTPLLSNGGGNMRAWIHRPCLPVDCAKPDWLSKNSDNSSRATPFPRTLTLVMNPGRYGRVVPDMTGLTEEQAKVALTPLQLAVTLVDKSGGAQGEKSVVDQIPKPGANLLPDSVVSVYIDVKR